MKPLVVRIAEDEVKKFVDEWEKDPYLWESEADIHAELYARIKAALSKNGLRPKKMKYTWEESGGKKEMVKPERFNWIYCEPKTYIGEKPYRPDLVIFQKLGKVHHVEKKRNVPMLWVCEIKYATEWSSLLSRSYMDKDIKTKLIPLLKQRKFKIKGAEYVCYLVLERYKQGKTSKKLASNPYIQRSGEKILEEKQKGRVRIIGRSIQSE